MQQTLPDNPNGLSGAPIVIPSMDASGNASYLKSFPKTSEFYRLAAY